MHKLTYILILTTLFATAHTQPQSEPVYKYSYNITVPVSACLLSVVQDSVIIEGQQSLMEIEVKDCNNNPITAAAVSLKRKGASKIKITTDEKGMAAMPVTEGEYTLTIASKDAMKYSQTVLVSHYQKRHMQIVLQSKPVKQRYVIRSKVWLLQAEVNMVKQCISDHKGDVSKCGRKLYYVMTRI